MRSLAALSVCLLTTISHAEELRILAWNVESDGNNPDVIVRQLHELSGYDIVGLTEVRASSINLQLGYTAYPLIRCSRDEKGCVPNSCHSLLSNRHPDRGRPQ